MPDRPLAVLRLEPHMIPGLRALFEECIELLADRLNRLGSSGRMLEAWMHDPVSERMREVYNSSVMEAEDSGYASLRLYEAELRRVHEELGRMQERYRRTEAGNAALFGERA